MTLAQLRSAQWKHCFQVSISHILHGPDSSLFPHLGQMGVVSGTFSSFGIHRQCDSGWFYAFLFVNAYLVLSGDRPGPFVGTHQAQCEARSVLTFDPFVLSFFSTWNARIRPLVVLHPPPQLRGLSGFGVYGEEAFQSHSSCDSHSAPFDGGWPTVEC